MKIKMICESRANIVQHELVLAAVGHGVDHPSLT